MENQNVQENIPEEAKKALDEIATDLGLDESGKLGLLTFIFLAGDKSADAFKKIITTSYNKGMNNAIETITDKIIYPLLDEYDRGLWERIDYIELAKEWIKVLDDNPYPKVKNHTEARKRDLRQWIAEKLKEQNK